MFPSALYVGNGWTDCAEIWCVVKDQIAMRFTPLRGGMHLHPKRGAHMCTPFPYLGNGRTDCAETWYAVRGQLARQFRQTKDWSASALAHVQMCPLFRISEAAGGIALKLGKRFETL